MRRFDADLFAHAVDVCTLVLVIGGTQGYPLEHLEVLGTGALLHDVGKMRLPRNLLRQSRDYNDQERSLLRQHPLTGATLLAHAESIHEDVRRIVAEHHECADGSGYPAGRTSAQLFPLSQLVSIVNLYDTLVGGCDSQPPMSPMHALRQLYQLGKRGQYDPVWVERVIRALGIYPIGTVVELNTGEQGVVLTTHPTQALRPTVQLVEKGAVASQAASQLVDLSKPVKKSEPERTILRVLDPAAARVILTYYCERYFG
jgi:putative nucleotidyltransferase with HDIG domain